MRLLVKELPETLFPLLAAGTAIVGVIAAISTKGADFSLVSKDSNFVIILIGTLVPAFAVLLLRYLGRFTSLSGKDYQRQMEWRFAMMHDNSHLDPKDRSEIVQELRKQIEAKATDEFLAGIKDDIHSSLETRFLTRHLESTVGRLMSEVRALTGRGNINLVIGICTAIVGLGTLGYVVFSQVPQTGDWHSILMYYAPRLSLAICIELFAYFFLRLYKTSLQDIKYFQNELTNIEMRSMALMAALQGSDSVTTANCLQMLAQTERNPTLFVATAKTSDNANKPSDPKRA